MPVTKRRSKKPTWTAFDEARKQAEISSVELLPRDEKGRVIQPGVRIYVPRRVPWHPRTLEEDPAKSASPAVRGRVLRVYAGATGIYVELRCASSQGVRTVPAEVCRVQQGPTKAEKSLSHAKKVGRRLA